MISLVTGGAFTITDEALAKQVEAYKAFIKA